MNDPMSKVLNALSPLLSKMSPEDEKFVRQQLLKFQDRLSSAVIVGEAGAGLVKYTTNGYGIPIKIEIDDIIFKETDKKLISDLFCAAANDNISKCQEHARTIESELCQEIMQAQYEGSQGGGYSHH